MAGTTVTHAIGLVGPNVSINSRHTQHTEHPLPGPQQQRRLESLRYALFENNSGTKSAVSTRTAPRTATSYKKQKKSKIEVRRGMTQLRTIHSRAAESGHAKSTRLAPPGHGTLNSYESKTCAREGEQQIESAENRNTEISNLQVCDLHSDKRQAHENAHPYLFWYWYFLYQ